MNMQYVLRLQALYMNGLYLPYDDLRHCSKPEINHSRHWPDAFPFSFLTVDITCEERRGERALTTMP